MSVLEHPTHTVYDEGYLASDPICKDCRLSPLEAPRSIAAPCGRPVVTYFWLGAEGRAL
jgi:hypothetical protein